MGFVAKVAKSFLGGGEKPPEQKTPVLPSSKEIDTTAKAEAEKSKKQQLVSA